LKKSLTSLQFLATDWWQCFNVYWTSRTQRVQISVA